MTRVLAMLSAAAGLAASARAQSTLDSTVTFSLSWTESDANGLPAGNGNGILEPGEHALIHLAVSFTNQNTVGTYSPFPPGPGSGTIRGFGWGFIDLNGMNNAPGTWNLDHDGFGLGTQDPWSGTVEAHSGTPINGGAGVMDMQMGQLPLSNAAIMDANPISPVWLGVWTPASFDARGVIFACAPGTASGGFAASVIFKTSAGPVGATCPVNLGSVQISIAPSPATSLLLTPLLLSRRRRAPHKD